MYFTYIIYSEKFDRFYIGQCQDFDDRIRRHNLGTEKATAPYIPWIKILVLQKDSRAEAMALERKLKNLNRQRLNDFIAKYS